MQTEMILYQPFSNHQLHMLDTHQIFLFYHFYHSKENYTKAYSIPLKNSLGVVFSTDVLEIVTINFENKLNEMKKVLNAWSRRNLTPFGRITVIKSLVISKITHPWFQFLFYPLLTGEHKMFWDKEKGFNCHRFSITTTLILLGHDGKKKKNPTKMKNTKMKNQPTRCRFWLYSSACKILCL